MCRCPQMKQRYTSRQPYGDWLTNNTVTLKQVVQSVPERERAIPPLHLTDTPENVLIGGEHATSVAAATSNGSGQSASEPHAAAPSRANGAGSNGAGSNGTGKQHAHDVDPLQLASQGGVSALLQPLKVGIGPSYSSYSCLH